jgi:hypothetical protein
LVVEEEEVVGVVLKRWWSSAVRALLVVELNSWSAAVSRRPRKQRSFQNF